MRNYINFYYTNDNRLIAEIHKQGNIKIVSKEEDINELINIARSYGHIIKDECIIKENFFTITRKYEEYINNKKKPLRVIGNILPNMKLSKNNPTIGKKVVAATLTTVLALNGVSALFNNTAIAGSADEDISYEQVIDSEENNYNFLNDENIIVEASYDFDENEKESNDLSSMLQTNQFNFSYEDRSNEENIINAHRYEDLFETYANIYGLDKNLLMAIAAQESCGEHYESLDDGPAEGIMQVEKDVHIGSTVTAYNFETGEMDTIPITAENLQDLETNIQIGTMLLRNCLEDNNYNIPLALQTYNFGPGNMQEVLSACSYLDGIDENTLRTNPDTTNWLNYREFLNTGDPLYVEHVFSFLPNDTTISIQDRNYNDIDITIHNDYQNINRL